MEIRLYFKDVPLGLIAVTLLDDLRHCGFRVSKDALAATFQSPFGDTDGAQLLFHHPDEFARVVELSAANHWSIVRFGRQKVFWDVSERVESHGCASIFMPTAGVRATPHLFQFFMRAIDNPALQVREGQLSVDASDESLYFTFSFTKAVHETPRVVIIENEDGSSTVLHPQDPGFWQNWQNLHFASFNVIKERNADPQAWAQYIGAGIHQRPQGIVCDCGWLDWCAGQKLNLRP